MPHSIHTLPGRRIVVVGTSGAGKSYVAQQLATRLGVPYVCNDAIIHRENWRPNPPAQRYIEFEAATRGDGWTYDGNIGGLHSPEDKLILQRADTLVWIDLPRFEVMRQLLWRTILRSWTREKLWHGNRESWRLSFASRDSILLWSWQTYDLRRRQYRRIFADPQWSHLRRIRFDSRTAVNRWLGNL